MSTFLWMLLNNSVHVALWSFEIGQNQTVQGRNIWHFCVSGINTPSLFFMAVVSPTEGTEGQIALVQLPTLWGLGPQLPLVAGLQWWGWGLLGMYRWDTAFFGVAGPNPFSGSAAPCEAGTGKDTLPYGLLLEVNLHQEAFVAPGLLCPPSFWRKPYLRLSKAWLNSLTASWTFILQTVQQQRTKNYLFPPGWSMYKVQLDEEMPVPRVPFQDIGTTWVMAKQRQHLGRCHTSTTKKE